MDLLCQWKIIMGDTNDTISKSLGIIDPKTEPPNKVVLPPKKTPENNDYEYARQNMYNIIERGSDALEDMLEIAKQSESARAFEVVTNLIKTLAETNKDLLDLAKKQKELTKEEEGSQKTVTNNNLFVGSSTELLKMIKQSSEKIDE